MGVDLVLPRLARENEAMGRRPSIVLFVLALIAVVVGVDVLFFRHHCLERLITNVGIVLIRGVLLQVPEAPVTGSEAGDLL
jgi:hypothetical protein